jgi:hypothetical protein
MAAKMRFVRNTEGKVRRGRKRIRINIKTHTLEEKLIENKIRSW